MALRAGYRTTLQTYKLAAITPQMDLLAALNRMEWDSYGARLFRYGLFDLYYFNATFTELEFYRVQHRKTEGLYRFTRGIINPYFRTVEAYVAKCYGGGIDWENLSSGAIPFNSLNDSLVEALINLFRWSNMGEYKGLLPRHTARYGDGVIKVVDEPDNGKVRLEFSHPGIVKEVEVNAVGHIKAITFEYQRVDPDSNKPYMYTEIIDQDHFATYRDGELYAYQNDANGRPVAEWDNPYGFVPVVLTKAKHIGRTWGGTPFVGGTLRKVDGVNDLASLLVDQTRKVVFPQWYFAGVSSAKQVSSEQAQVSTDEDDQAERQVIPFITGPEGSQPHAMVAALDLSAGLEEVDKLIKEIEDDVPVLAFLRMKELEQHSAPAVMTVLGPAIDHIQEFRGNIDGGLARACQMAITIGGIRNYPGFEPFGPDDYGKGNLDFQVADRPIIRDQLSKKEMLEFFIQSDAPPRWIWTELDKTEQEIAQAELDLFTQQRSIAATVAQSLATGINEPDQEEERVNA